MTELQLDEKLNFVEEPVEIMDREVKQLNLSRIPIVKVRWNSKRGPDALAPQTLLNDSELYGPELVARDEAITFIPYTFSINFPITFQKVNGRSPKENILQNEIDRLLEVSLTSEIRNCVSLSVEKQKNELLKAELEKSSSDSKDIQAKLLKRIKILENDFKRSQAQSIDFKLKLQHQKEKMACDVSWKSKLSTINDENVLLKTQMDSVVKEGENIKLEYQKLFNSIEATQTQHQKELDELIEHVNQNTYAYADVRA
ncbi:hypothetical protein Tco_1314548 [Tanacetum coccineum]